MNFRQKKKHPQKFQAIKLKKQKNNQTNNKLVTKISKKVKRQQNKFSNQNTNMQNKNLFLKIKSQIQLNK